MFLYLPRPNRTGRNELSCEQTNKTVWSLSIKVASYTNYNRSTDGQTKETLPILLLLLVLPSRSFNPQ
jgi:hypothetical protein